MTITKNVVHVSADNKHEAIKALKMALQMVEHGDYQHHVNVEVNLEYTFEDHSLTDTLWYGR